MDARNGRLDGDVRSILLRHSIRTDLPPGSSAWGHCSLTMVRLGKTVAGFPEAVRPRLDGT